MGHTYTEKKKICVYQNSNLTGQPVSHLAILLSSYHKIQKKVYLSTSEDHFTLDKKRLLKKRLLFPTMNVVVMPDTSNYFIIIRQQKN